MNASNNKRYIVVREDELRAYLTRHYASLVEYHPGESIETATNVLRAAELSAEKSVSWVMSCAGASLSDGWVSDERPARRDAMKKMETTVDDLKGQVNCWRSLFDRIMGDTDLMAHEVSGSHEEKRGMLVLLRLQWQKIANRIPFSAGDSEIPF